jgi:glycosyltransferase involved in cell wall biosynthesis
LHVCIVYDCIYPHTVGGAERWYRNLAERLAEEGHEVTYLTLRQWDRGAKPTVAGVDLREAGPRMALYEDGGRRRILPPLVFGLGVLWHLLLHGRRYDVVHTASFPYFSVLAAAFARLLHRYLMVIDWHEVWTREYWNEYLGRLGGLIGWQVQRRCARVHQHAFCFSQLHRRRLEEEQVNGPVTVLEGEYAGDLSEPEPVEARQCVVFAGRHIPEKRVPLLVDAMAVLRERRPDLRCEIYGDGPTRGEVLARISELGLDDVVTAPGFVARDTLETALHSALCMVLPSRREGYGLVVVEAAARATPAVVVAGPDNAATELVEPGVNGEIAPADTAQALADAIERVADAGPALRASTGEWFGRNARRLSLGGSLDLVARCYAGGTAALESDAVPDDDADEEPERVPVARR